MSNETRRRIADRVLERMRARGFPLDRDPELMALIDRWCEGDMEMHECHRQYLALKGRRDAARRLPPLRDLTQTSGALSHDKQLDWSFPPFREAD
jgi:hypothetical protein